MTEQYPAGVVVDVTALDVVDSLAVRMFRDLACMSRPGTETVIAGIRPEVAAAMGRFGLTLHDITTARDCRKPLPIWAPEKKKRSEPRARDQPVVD